MKSNTRVIILAIIVLFLMTLAVIHRCPKTQPQPKSDVDTLIEWRYDTIVVRDTIRKTSYIKEKVIKTDTITKDTVLTTIQKQYNDTLCNDSDSVVLKSFISGINAQRDSMQVMWKKHEKIKTITIINTQYVEKKPPIVALRPTVAFGYDPINRGWSGVVGVGLVLNW